MASTSNILIIEDETPIAKALELKLSGEGFSVTRASNGTEGLESLKEKKPDIILLDLVMPDTDGFDVLEYINKNDKDIPVFVLTNLSQEEDKDKALKLGAKKFFIKSNMPIADIVDEVKKLLGA